MKTSVKAKPAAAAPVVRKPASDRKTARLFTNGASQAVRLPKEFRMEGTEVRIWKEGDRVVMEPMLPRQESLADVLDRFYADCPDGLQIERAQPPMQERDWSVLEPAVPAYAAKAGAKKKR